MKSTRMVAFRLVALAVILAPSLSIAADVGVSVSIGEPGFYGHIEIGSFPQPQVIYPEPVIIRRVPVGVVLTPIYLHVPPGHEKHWSKHCRKYNACGQPVYFVQQGWYNNVYVPDYRKRHGQGQGDDNDHGAKHNDKGHRQGKDKH